MKKYAVIVAGGKGNRMGSELPKQFIQLNDKPILMYTLLTFKLYIADIQIILVLPANDIQLWKELCIKHSFNIEHTIAEGGETRFHSVKNGLQLVDNDSLVAIHDGVRPFVSKSVIENSFITAQTHKAVVPVIDIVDTIRELGGSESHTVSRDKYKIVQTPQTFLSNIVKDAYSQDYDDKFTDDASVVESVGVKIKLIEGNRENIKITTPFDLIIGNALVKCST